MLRNTGLEPDEIGHLHAHGLSTRTGDIEEARAITAAFETPESRGKGVVKVAGRMVERLHLEQAQQLVALAEAIEARAR